MSLRRHVITRSISVHNRFISSSGEQKTGGSRGGFFSVLRYGPRNRAELFGLCLGCAMCPLSIYLINWCEGCSNGNNNTQPELVLGNETFVTHGVAAPDKGSKYPLGGPFRLRESRTGNYITDKELFQDHWTLLYFGFSKCAEVCPSTLRFITDVMKACDEKLAGDKNLSTEAARLQAVFLSVDSRRDTPEVLEGFVSKYDPRVRGLTGTSKEIEQAARAWRVYYSSIDETDEEKSAREAKGVPMVGADDDTYQLDHSSAIYLVGVDGKLKDFFFKEMGVADAVGRLEVHLQDVYGFKDTRG
ncbi:cytochrome c oxidase assembly factor, putative [Trypanosoma brucei gambiense DAL972]|uniref:Cytochrome c oxidase assembly factor, putative n=2 Tax=Trypanosoma brucei TaxID=5691 RepID=C9ZI98_TRYB9|nr:cytochrome c oxidase assembly factor, putative [Trypanosoma brucei gambiense DAL972]CBH08890.1 cytochrome c oxidase assembly factor, putative [Trypanosoma brucei gambiense DAL972]|eukprot:XP_011771331.1 cytochrome c oxidase assembly factor, putative [Trypanosoma brucei gambiense DAL972]